MTSIERPLAVSIDAGQTGTKVRVERAGEAPVERVLPGVRTHEPLLPQLAEATRSVVREHGGAVDVVAGGVSGLTSREADAGALLALLSDVAPARVLLAHDSVTSFLGTLGDARGAVVAAGTGVVTLAVGRRSVARVDGWGNIMGDAGSGYWIGRAALDAAMRAHDGRGPATALSGVVRDRWPDLEEAYIDLQADPERVSIVASFARPVAELADGDAVAAGICRAAADELAHSVVTALARVADGAPEPPRVSAVGGVFRSRIVRGRFEERLRDTHPDAVLEAAHGTGLDGAATLRTLAAGHPLEALVSAARRGRAAG